MVGHTAEAVCHWFTRQVSNIPSAKMPENTVQASQNEVTDVPSWLDEQYVEKLLRCALKEKSIKLKQLIFNYAVPKGDNFASIIYRIQVVYHAKEEYETTRTFIVKGMITEGLAGEKLRQYDVQRKEMDVYQYIVPELKRMMQCVGERSELYPSALAVDRKHELILFKDLALDGYRMADRTKGLDMVHLKMACKVMAKLHAGSLKLREEEPTIFDDYRTGMMTRETEAFHPMFVLIFDALADEIARWGPEWDYYRRKLEILRPNFVEYGLRVFDNDPEADDLCVFVHGDLWVNNLLYKYDTQEGPIDAVLLDFQYCCYGTPMIDFCYLYYTSARDEIRQNCLDELLQYYYYALRTCARDLKYLGKFPTLHQFLQQSMRKMFYGVYSTFIALPVQMNDKTENADFDALMGDDERAQIYKRTIVSNDKFRKIIQGLLPQFDRKGLLDPLY